MAENNEKRELDSKELEQVSGGLFVGTDMYVHCKDCGHMDIIYQSHHQEEYYEEPDPSMQIEGNITECKKCHSKNIEII